MPDAYYVGAWHRYIQVRARGRSGQAFDAGISLVELLIAIVILATGLIGTAAEVAAYVKHQVVERSQQNANHLADSWFEYAESLERNANTESVNGGNANVAFQTVSAAGTTTTTTKVHGVTYTERTTPRFCLASTLASPTFALSSCPTSPPSGWNSSSGTVYGTIFVQWKVGGQVHQLTQTRNLADDTTYKPADTTDPASNALSNCTRAGTNPTGVLSITAPTNGPGPGSPQPVDLDASNHPIASSNGNVISLRLDTLGMVDATVSGGYGPATCVPLFWTDQNGTHQVDMHTTPTACPITQANYTSVICRYTATVPTAAITQPVAGPTWDGTVAFSARLRDANSTATPAVTAISANTTLYVDAPPSWSTCNAQSTASLLGILLGINNIQVSQVNNFTGSGSNMATGTTLTVTYTQTNGSLGTFTFLPAVNTTAWTLSGTNSFSYTIGIAKNGIVPTPKNSVGLNVLGVIVGGTVNSFSYTATRNDGKTVTCGPKNVTVFS
jgi:Tfp pilus assembly protein PilV